MFQKILTSKKFLIALAVTAIGALIFSFIKPKVVAPQLTSTTPPNNSTKFSVMGTVEMQFSSVVTASDFTITSTPDSDWQIIQRDDRVLVATHKSTLKPSTKYTLNLSWKNQLISTLIFVTENTQTDYGLITTVKDEVARDYPLAKSIPYSTDLYYVVYSAPLTLEITIKNDTILPPKAISDIKAWVTSLGGDVNAHQYVIGTEPPPPKTISAPAKTNIKEPSPSPTPFDWSTLKDDGT